ncbi:DUF4468 domain-containing protein [Flavobacterium sp. LMO8]|uniref:DUF4468 domain-containing protein n=1 Tax=Flavobacterium sp. LMO8 TaxID=2654244 RepID=UPI0012919981|nr:DUF4468 domain-containing protein [Flavobacterium sp. LMO8]MQP25582.1 DUF4468 domain-containing protein [Flavobacterium sp. LMO8]
MKQSIFGIIFSFFVIPLFGQTIVKDSISGKYQSEGVVVFDSIKADMIFTKAKEWIAINYKSANDVIQLADKESLKIIVKGNFKTSMFMKDVWIAHTLILDFKDNKLRYFYSNFSYYSSGSGSLEFESKSLGFKKSVIKTTEKNLIASIDDLKKYIIQNRKSDW